ncbi:DUF4258 domain-containing protein [Salinarimonas ramus]|uniref:DUF4258 domain-containing protein n=1 Tax=Salinarimonas ramus TaxID=690164 RepID=A0A917V2P0_9HYPH|nr:hypothetical protein GCM10011322_07540 [Salinarimonas ramus]
MGEQPWAPADATDRLRALARDPDCELALSSHARDRLGQRDLTTADVLWVLKTGFVTSPPQQVRSVGRFRYRIDGPAPNTGRRSIRVVVIPDEDRCMLFVVTVMWIDEG